MPVFADVPLFDDVLPFLKTIIVSARKIPAGSPSLWKGTVLHSWTAELARLSALFDDAMSDPTPLKLFSAVFNFVAAPGAVLGPWFKTPAHGSTEITNAAVTAAINKIMRGQERKAMKVLCSNGVAKVNQETVSVLMGLHPERKNDLVLPSQVYHS